MKKKMYTLCVFVSFIKLYMAPPVDKSMKQANDGMYNTDGLTHKQAQDQEYFRYLTQVVGELEKDPIFHKLMENATEDDIKSGKFFDMYDFVGHDIREKVDEIKRMEVEYQRDLIRQKKHHMVGIEDNNWNPIHHDNKETFEKEDLKKLLHRHNDIISEQDKIRHEQFKKYELEKEHKRRESIKNMTALEKVADEKKHNALHHKQHEKLHEPGHKAQIEEVWETEDGLDPDSFDSRTFFNLHDKNSDGHWDYFELETLFLHDLDKVYNKDDPETDTREREEEMERMREHALQTMDHDRDGLISMEEFMSESKSEEFAKEEEWKPLTEEDQYTGNEFAEYERLLDGDHLAANTDVRHETNGGKQHENDQRPQTSG